MERRMIFLICFLLVNAAQGQLQPEWLLVKPSDKEQEGFALGKIDITTPAVKSLKDFFQVTDTLEFFDNHQDVLRVEGFDFEFTIRVHRDSTIVNSGEKPRLMMESRIPPFPIWRYDLTDLNSDDLERVSRELKEMPYDTIVLRQGFQTCISYALEGIFRSHGIDPEPFFYRRSNVAKHEDIELILENLFVKVETLGNIRKRTLRRSEYLLEDQVFILFRNTLGEPMHACFNLNDRTWTKNGMSPYTSHLTPYPVIDNYNSKKKIRYNSSETFREFMEIRSVVGIEIYKLNVEMFR